MSKALGFNVELPLSFEAALPRVRTELHTPAVATQDKLAQDTAQRGPAAPGIDVPATASPTP